MVLILGDNSMMTLSYTFTKMLFKETDKLSTFEVFAARTVSQFICTEFYNYFLNRQKKKEETEKED